MIYACCVDFPDYVISENGDVYSEISCKFMKPRKDYRGYPRLNLKVGSSRKTIFIHQLVARAFIPNPEKYLQINHKDGNKTNNNVSNLEWCNAQYNLKHAYDTGLMKCRRRPKK